jgi:hypothetical protein
LFCYNPFHLVSLLLPETGVSVHARSSPDKLMFELAFADDPPMSARWLRDGQALGPDIPLDGPILRTLDEIRIAFDAMFAHHNRRPIADADAVRALGRTLADVFFQPVASHLPTPTDTGPFTLLIRSANPTAFNLPWELVTLPGRGRPPCASWFDGAHSEARSRAAPVAVPGRGTTRARAT